MNFKELIEKRNELVDKVNALFTKADTEKRALSTEEIAMYESVTKEIKDIDKTLELADESRSFSNAPKSKEEQEKRQAEEQYGLECRAFASYLRENITSYKEERSEVNFAKTNNGAVIPKTIANKIIETVENICPIYAMATKYRVNGELVFPVYDETNGGVTASYATEFTELTATAGKFTTVSLNGFLVGVLTKISNSLINNVDFALVPYVITKVAQAIDRFLEKELLFGTESKMQGVLASKNAVTITSVAITADDLIDLQMTVPQKLQSGCRFIMNYNTLKAIRKLKNKDGDYLLTKDLTKGFGFMLLGMPVEISDQMEDIADKKTPIVYGDFSGLCVNIHEDVNMQMLREKYATQHATGVVAWLEMDSKIVEPQKIAVLKCAVSA